MGSAIGGPFQGYHDLLIIKPRVVAGAPNPGLKLANAFGVFSQVSKLNHYSEAASGCGL